MRDTETCNIVEGQERIRDLEMDAAKPFEGKLRQGFDRKAARNRRPEIEPHVRARPTFEWAAKNLQAEFADNQPSKISENILPVLQSGDDRFSGLRLGQKLQPGSALIHDSIRKVPPTLYQSIVARSTRSNLAIRRRIYQFATVLSAETGFLSWKKIKRPPN